MKGILILIVLAISAAISAFLWPYAINTWLEYFGKEPAMLWWHGLIMGFIPGVGQMVLPVAAVTWVLMMFLV